ncbi:MAG: efflux RND transporter periplasmic adaptor subunit [Candidatus Metalachnospira sp.]|nr:efflux RND transporter periplasmic adaptor subunit [Candidatus Metalachnospira sp.]
MEEEKNLIDSGKPRKFPKLNLGGIGSKFSGMSKKKKIIGIIVIILIILIIIKLVPNKNDNAEGSSEYSYATAQKMNITESLSGSGTLQPADQYTVTTLLKGDIIGDTFEEGDLVKKDQILYQLDSADAQTSIERAEISAASTQRSYQTALKSLDDLNVKSKVDGIVVDLAVKVGDNVTAGQQVATVRDDSEMTLELSFPADEASNFYIGQPATVTLYGSFETLSGYVSEVSGATQVITGNIMVRTVKISVDNPGAISDSQLATAEVGTSGSTSSGKFTYKENRAIYSEVSGEVSKIVKDEGASVSKGTTIMVLESDNVTDSVKSASDSVRDSQLSLESQYEDLDNYTIKSPIDGTVISKLVKTGDTIDSAAKLCIIYDLSYLKILMNVDELDISKVSVGQKVQITADAVEGETFEGTVTSVNLAGTTTNGVTTYPVEVQIVNFGDLLPGMNVDTEIVVEDVQDVIGVPVSAVVRGNKVLVQTGGTSDDPTIPAGYEYVDVEIGISSDDFIEIKSGIDDGASIAYTMQGDSMSYDDVMMSDGGGEVAVESEDGPPHDGGGNGPRG